MKIVVLAVGMVKERSLAALISEHKKRLSRYSSVSIRELREIPYRESLSESQKEQIKQQEGERILRLLRENWHVVALDLGGSELTSLEFADYIRELTVSGKSNLAFVIGGSLGLSQEVLNRSDFRLSLSKMTLPHQIARLVLLEQLYRSFKIIRGETYHK